jgi:hypothetical protein
MCVCVCAYIQMHIVHVYESDSTPRHLLSTWHKLFFSPIYSENFCRHLFILSLLLPCSLLHCYAHGSDSESESNVRFYIDTALSLSLMPWSNFSGGKPNGASANF